MALRVSDPHFNLKAFEGPLDLLVHLVEKKELDVYEVVVSEVTQQYHSYLKTLSEYDLDVSGEFLSVVSSLMLLKSKMLLPKHDQQESLDESTLRFEILDQLLHYYKFKNLALHLSAQESVQSKRFARGVVFQKDEHKEAPLLKPSSQTVLYDLFLEILKKNAHRNRGAIEEESYRVADMMTLWKQKLSANSALNFDREFSAHHSKLKLITLFLALLQLLKDGFAKVILNNEALEIKRENI